jgi:hypothetical protein
MYGGGGEKVFGFIKKTTSHGIEKHVFILHIHPQTCNFIVLFSVQKPFFFWMNSLLEKDISSLPGTLLR